MSGNLSPALVICLAFGLVAAINAGLYIALARGNSQAQIRTIERAVRSVRDPWKSENQAVEELHQRVARLPELEPGAQDSSQPAAPPRAGGDGPSGSPTAPAVSTDE